MRPTISIIIEPPKMQKLVDRARVGLEVSDQLLVVTALLERRKANFLIELYCLRHCADPECISSQFVESHRTFPPYCCEPLEPPLPIRTVAANPAPRLLYRIVTGSQRRLGSAKPGIVRWNRMSAFGATAEVWSIPNRVIPSPLSPNLRREGLSIS